MSEKDIPLTLEAMKRGKVLEELNDALHRILKDIALRPDINKPRAVAIKFTVKPGEGPPPNFPTVEYTIEPKIPSETGGALSIVHNRNGEFTLPAAAYEQTTMANITPINNAQ